MTNTETTMRRTYGWKGFHSEFDADPLNPGACFAQATSPQGERREFSFARSDDAHNFCVAAVDNKHANHRRVWAPERRALDDIERDARSFLDDRKTTEDIGETQARKFIAGFAIGFRDVETDIETLRAPGDNAMWFKGYNAGRHRAQQFQTRDARLHGRGLADIRKFQDAPDAFDAMRADCLAFLRGLDTFIGRNLAPRTDDKSWERCGDLGRLREALRGEAMAFGLIDYDDELENARVPAPAPFFSERERENGCAPDGRCEICEDSTIGSSTPEFCVSCEAQHIENMERDCVPGEEPGTASERIAGIAKRIDADGAPANERAEDAEILNAICSCAEMRNIHIARTDIADFLRAVSDDDADGALDEFIARWRAVQNERREARAGADR